MHSGRSQRRSCTVFASVTKDQHLSHGSGSLRNWVDLIWESDFVVFLLLAQRLYPKADVPRRHGPSGWRVQAGLRAGVRVKSRGWRSGEGQGYGRVGVVAVVRSEYPTPLGRHLSGHCLPSVQLEQCHPKNLNIRNVWHCVWNRKLCSRDIIFDNFFVIVILTPEKY